MPMTERLLATWREVGYESCNWVPQHRTTRQELGAHLAILSFLAYNIRSDDMKKVFPKRMIEMKFSIIFV
jgi:hypothetical protein